MPRRLPTPNALAHPIVHRLYSELAKREMSLIGLATASGLQKNTVQRIWRREMHPRLDQLQLICNTLGLELVLMEKKEGGSR